MEGVEEEIKQHDAKLALMERATTPAIDDTIAGILEEEMPSQVTEDSIDDELEIEAALADLDKNLPQAKEEEMDTSEKIDDIPEIESEFIPETIEDMVPAETQEEVEPETLGEETEGEEEDTITQVNILN
jgi:hypothetical protein